MESCCSRPGWLGWVPFVSSLALAAFGCAGADTEAEDGSALTAPAEGGSAGTTPSAGGPRAEPPPAGSAGAPAGPTTAGSTAAADSSVNPASEGDMPTASAAANDDSEQGEVFLAPLGPPPRTDTYVLTVNLLGAGRGRVVSIPPGIDCGTSCSAAFPGGTAITLRARPENGSDSVLSGWSVPYCQRYRDCDLIGITIDETTEVSFEPMTANIAFINQEVVPTNLGSARAYDDVCNATATRAGLNNLAGDRFVALVSDSSESFRTRLGDTASGWMLLDGRPFGNTTTELFDEQRVLNALNVNEQGQDLVIGPVVITNSLANGTSISVNDNCSGLTSLSGTFGGGNSNGGPGAWLEDTTYQCGPDMGSIYCLGHDLTSVVTPQPVQGLRIWLSNEPFHPGTGTPDEACRAGLPPNATDARALIATTTNPASALLVLDQLYVRPDGVVIGTGDDLIQRDWLSSGIWQKANGDYVPAVDPYDDTSVPSRVWTGELDLATAGSVESTCNDWASTVGNAYTGDQADDTSAFWSDGTTRPCDWTGGGYVYCVEVASGN